MSAAHEPGGGHPSGGIFISLGSNLGDRKRHIESALRELNAHPRIRVLRVSSLLDNPAVGGPHGQPDFVNAVAELHTDLTPHPLLEVLQSIEAAHGRTRDVPNGPRTLDLDLLLYRHQVIRDPSLQIPHPRMDARPFVMVPLTELIGSGNCCWPAGSPL